MSICIQVERFLAKHHLPPTKFGRLAANDPRLVLDMRNGRELGPQMEHRLRAFMQGYAAAMQPGQRETA